VVGFCERHDVLDALAACCSEQLCAICYDDYVDSDELRVLPCRHYFHKACIDRWAFACNQRAPSCPLCNQSILDPLAARVHPGSGAAVL